MQEQEEEEEEIEREEKEGGFFQRYYKFSECSCFMCSASFIVISKSFLPVSMIENALREKFLLQLMHVCKWSRMAD